ncbi:MAG TPA: hypothetical protein VKR54_02330 [Candidatus Babeliales bacterium]|jgi:hypothetical protein|nr:hypothetical protein [Candidatus Babeliales bacterium]
MRKYFIVCLLTAQAAMMMGSESMEIKRSRNKKIRNNLRVMALKKNQSVPFSELGEMAGSGEFAIDPQQPESPSEIFSRSNSWCEQSCSPDLREWRT